MLVTRRGGSEGKESACNAGDLSSIPGLFGKVHWRREWLPTPILLLEEFHGQRHLGDYSPWGYKESDSTEWLTLSVLVTRSSYLLFFLFFFFYVWKDTVMGFIKILPKLYIQLPKGLLFSQNPEHLILNFQGSTASQQLQCLMTEFL